MPVTLLVILILLRADGQYFYQARSGYSAGELELMMVLGLQDGPSLLVYCRRLIH